VREWYALAGAQNPEYYVTSDVLEGINSVRLCDAILGATTVLSFDTVAKETHLLTDTLNDRKYLNLVRGGTN
jgi:hypothetical protein